MKTHLIVQAIVASAFMIADGDGYTWIMAALGWFILVEFVRS